MGLRGDMAQADAGDADSPRRQIHLVEETGGTWSAIDEGAGVASQGETRSEALANLDEAAALHEGEIEEPVTDTNLRDLGLDPETVPDEPQVPAHPSFLSDRVGAVLVQGTRRYSHGDGVPTSGLGWQLSQTPVRPSRDWRDTKPDGERDQRGYVT